MKTPPSFARSGVAVLVTAASAVALNVGIVRATSGSNPSVDAVEVTSAVEPGVAATLLASARSADLVAHADAEQADAEQAEAVAATPAPAPTAPAVAEHAPATTNAPATTQPAAQAAAVAPVTTYETFAINGVGSVVIANHGSSLEFWAAYTEPGWAYGTEDPTGKEIVVKFRADRGEVEWKAKLSNGKIRVSSSVSMEDENDD